MDASARQRLGTLVLGASFLGLAPACFTSEPDLVSRVEAIEVPAPFDEGLVINGFEVPQSMLRRELVYQLGNHLLESAKLDLFIQEEMEAQIEAGADPNSFEITSDEVQGAADQAVDQIREQYPTEDVETVLASNRLDQGRLMDQVRQTRLFDRVFLPPNPRDWPESTVALMEGSGGQQLVDKLIESWETREAAGEEINPDDPSMAMWKTILRKLVIQGLNKNAVVKTAADGLPDEVCLEVNGRQVLTDDLYELVSANVTPSEMERARMWLAKTISVEQALRAGGHLLEGEALAEAWDAHEEPYRESPFPLEVLAMGFKKFPSMDSYKRYFQLMESYHRSLGELTDDELGAHLESRANQMLGLAQVNAEIILCAAFDFRTNSWPENGWDAAAAEAREVAIKLRDGQDWYEVLEAHSDFWDPPTPQNAQFNQPQQRKNGGRFGPLNRNELVQRIGESEFDMFLLGTSVADYVFFNQEEGSVDGPFRGTHGYYITRVLTRTNPTRPPLSLAQENQRELIVQDYMSVKFNEYAHGVMGEAAIQGLVQ